ncbi:MAG TPA: hypothetical protein VGM54_10145 [Chthoniobacter sp.]
MSYLPSRAGRKPPVTDEIGNRQELNAALTRALVKKGVHNPNWLRQTPAVKRKGVEP